MAFDVILRDNGAGLFDVALATPSLPANLIGYAVSTGSFDGSSGYGTNPTTAWYQQPSLNTQRGMIKLGEIVYTDEACTTAVAGNFTWWGFHKDSGGTADRSIQLDGDGRVIGLNFRNGVVFGYAAQGGNCSSTTGFESIYNAPDDVQEWYTRKAVMRSANTIGGTIMQLDTYALSYVNNGSVIGTASFVDINNFQRSYTSMTSCSVAGQYFKVYIRD